MRLSSKEFEDDLLMQRSSFNYHYIQSYTQLQQNRSSIIQQWNMNPIVLKRNNWGLYQFFDIQITNYNILR